MGREEVKRILTMTISKASKRNECDVCGDDESVISFYKLCSSSVTISSLHFLSNNEAPKCTSTYHNVFVGWKFEMKVNESGEMMKAFICPFRYALLLFTFTLWCLQIRLFTLSLQGWHSSSNTHVWSINRVNENGKCLFRHVMIVSFAHSSLCCASLSSRSFKDFSLLSALLLYPTSHSRQRTKMKFVQQIITKIYDEHKNSKSRVSRRKSSWIFVTRGQEK